MMPVNIVDALEDEGIKLSSEEVIEEIKQINQKNEITVYVNAPRCRDCNFTNWDDRANIPSQCPECKSEWIEEPKFTINT